MDKAAQTAFTRLMNKARALDEVSATLGAEEYRLEWLGLSTTRIQQRIATNTRRNDEVWAAVEQGIIEGRFPEDAPTICAEALGELHGYVADLYADAWDEAQWKLNQRA